MEEPQLNTCPFYTHQVCGFHFYITFDGKNGVDQHGAKWVNVATNENSIMPEPVNPKYLDVYLDAFNNIKKYFE